MHLVKPRVFLVGETRVVEEGLQAYLEHIGAQDWTTDAPTDLERLAEVYGRICYRSFKPGLNPNVTQVRRGNGPYLGNILASRHGSVIEHPRINFIFSDVSRVFTHELLRHRVGLSFSDVDAFDLMAADQALSQESLRYVRLDELGCYLPTVISEDELAMRIFVETFEQLEQLQRVLAEHFGLDKDGADFHLKKTVTSALRRIAPMGLSTTIGWSGNPRTIRWAIETRTDPGAEEEIRQVFGEVAVQVIQRYPNLFGDFTAEIADGLLWYKPKYPKV